MIKECYLADSGIRFKTEELDRYYIPHPKSPLWPSPDGTPSPSLVSPQHDPHRDAIAPLFDELKSPKWWILEFLPFVNSEQDELDNWKTWFR